MMEEEEASPLHPDNEVISSPASSSLVAAAAATKVHQEVEGGDDDNDDGDNNANNNSSSPSPSSSHHHHRRRSKREKYSPSRFVARPSTRRTREAAARSGPSSSSSSHHHHDLLLLLDDDTNIDKSELPRRRRTPRTHAAPNTYEDPPDVDEFDSSDDDDDVDTGGIKQPTRKKKRSSSSNNNNTTTTTTKKELQISSTKLYNPITKRSLCNVLGCGKADQMRSGGFCRGHFNLFEKISTEDNNVEIQEDEEEDDDDEIEEEEEIIKEEEDMKPAAAAAATATNVNDDDDDDIDPTKPRYNSTIRILSGEFAGLTGNITYIKVAGWCNVSNVQVTKPIRMSNMEVLAQNGPVVKQTPIKRKRRKVDETVCGSSRGGRPVRERKPPQSLSPGAASSPLSRPRRSTRGGGDDASSSSSPYSNKRDSSIRRSKRGPTPSPKVAKSFDYDDDDDDDEEVIPRGRRGRAAAAAAATPSKPSSSTSTPVRKDAHLCKAPSCRKFCQGSYQGYCTTCYKLFKAGAFDTSPNRGGSANRMCQVMECTKFNQYNCEGYCMKHYREFVLEEEEEEEAPPKKRARRGAKHEVEDEEDEGGVDDDESPFDDPPRTGGTGHSSRHYCKVKQCDKWSQGRPKDGMCFIHFRQYGFGDGKKKERSSSDVADEEEIESEIGVGSLVMVKERRGAGMNKPGGVGRVTKVYSVDDEEVMVYDVKYILGGREKGVDANSLWLHDINAKSPMKPPPSFGGEEEDVVMLDEDDESIEDDELEGYDEFSFSELEVPDQSVLDQRAIRREKQLNALSGNNLDEDDDDHHHRLEENWKCAECGGLNRPSATSRCTTCQSYRVEKNASEDALLERTRYDLLNGNDFWICTDCVIGVPSLLMPCGRCHSNISFVPLTMPEFEDFVRKQRQIKRKREREIEWEWDQKLEKVAEEWEETKEKELTTTTVSTKSHQQLLPLFQCKTLGCRETSAPDFEGFCEDHYRSVIVMEEPESYPIVRSEDKQLISDYFYLTYEQFRPCVLQDWERTKKHKESKMVRGHPGIACRHCFGREDPTLRSMGRYFPSTENSLYQQTFTSNAVRHLLECPKCPKKVSHYFAMMLCLPPHLSN